MRITTTIALAGVLALCPATARAQMADAHATLHDAAGNTVGTVDISDGPLGVLLHANIQGLPSGVHAFHIHGTGSCEPTFGAAGGHFNPTGKHHGLMNPEGHHAGDMPNIHLDGGRSVELEVFVPGVSVSGGHGHPALLDDDGAAIVIHAGADDYASDPAGAAGDRIACGVITRS